MDQEFGIIGLLPPSFPLPLSTPPPPSSSSQPTPPQFSQAGWPKGNYWLPARYEDFNPEPLWLLKEEDKQPTAALPHLRLIVCNRLQVSQAWIKRRLSSDFFLVQHPSVWRTTARAIQYNCHDTIILNGRMACICKNSVTYWEYSTASRTAYNEAWEVDAEV